MADIKPPEERSANMARIPQEMAKSENIASVYRQKNWDPEYIHLHNCAAADIMEIVLASCAIPLFFKAKRIGGGTYIDGGWADNMPIRPLLKKGYKRIAIVHLRNKTEYELLRRERSLQGLDLSDTEIIDIYPSIPLYEYDTLHVDQNRILELMECGYKDAKEAFEKTGAGHMEKSVEGF